MEGLQWAAIFQTAYFAPCLEPISLYTAKIISWDALIAKYIQNTGAIGFINCFYTPPIYQYFYFDEVDVKKGTSFDDIITIFAVWLSVNDLNFLLTSTTNAMNFNIPFNISSISADKNPNDILVEPSFCYYFYRIVSAICFAFCLFSIGDLARILWSFHKGGSGGRVLSAESIPLWLIFFGNVTRLVIFIDPNSLFQFVSLTTITILSSISHFFHFFASLLSMKLWFRLVILVETSLSYQILPANSEFLFKNSLLQIVGVLCAILILLLDLYTSYAGFICWYDPILNGFATTPMFGTAQDTGGILQNSFWEIVLLFLLSVVQILMSLYIQSSVKKLRAHISAGKLISSNDQNQLSIISQSQNRFQSSHPSQAQGPSRVQSLSGSTPKRRNSIAPSPNQDDASPRSASQDMSGGFDDFATKLADKLGNQSRNMLFSGFMMTLAAILTSLFGIQEFSFGKFNPYVFFVITTGTYLLVQVSSFLDGRCIENYIQGKRTKKPVKKKANRAKVRAKVFKSN